MYQLVRGAWKVPGASPELRGSQLRGLGSLTRQCHNAVTLAVLGSSTGQIASPSHAEQHCRGQAEDTAPRAND